jgi:hypothetical protein
LETGVHVVRDAQIVPRVFVLGQEVNQVDGHVPNPNPRSLSDTNLPALPMTT